jgi:hypothetical protein
MYGVGYQSCLGHEVSCDSGDMSDAMGQILEARGAFEQAKIDAKALVDRKRAQLGLTMIRAREGGTESQATIASKMGVGPQQVRAYEQAYREWLRDHPGESLDED